MHGENGRDMFQDFYDQVREPEEWEREELSKLPITEAKYAEFLGIKEFLLLLAILRWKPSVFVRHFEFNGVGGGYQGRARKP